MWPEEPYMDPPLETAACADTEKPPSLSPEAADVLTPNPRYHCRACSKVYMKWSQCEQHLADNIDCRNRTLGMMTGAEPGAQLIDVCRIVSAAVPPCYQ